MACFTMQAEVEGYDDAYHPELMTFMDFRRHHSGVHDGMAHELTVRQTCVGCMCTIRAGCVCQ